MSEKINNKINCLIHSKTFWPLVALVVVLIVNFFFTPGFFSIEIKEGHLYGSLIDILNRGVPLIIMSIGMTFVIATEGIDISVGAIGAMSAAVGASFVVKGHVVLGITAAITISIIAGIWNGMLVAKIGIQPMVATLILMTVGRGIAQLITKGQIITINDNRYSFIGGGFFLGLPFAVFIAVGMVLLAYFIMRKTALGLFIESVGANKISSRYTGIDSTKIIFLVYIICGLCAGIGGILISSNVKCADANNAGLWMELDAILAVVIGGTSMTGGRFYIGGSIIGALFIQSLTTTIYAMGVPPETILVVKALVVIIVSLLQSPEFRKMFLVKDKRREAAAE